MRAYFVAEPGEGCLGIAFVAPSSAEAKKMGYKEFGGEWIDIKPKWLKNIDVSGLPLGEIDPMAGLKRSVYSFTFSECPICGKVDLLYFEGDRICCGDCEEARP